MSASPNTTPAFPTPWTIDGEKRRITAANGETVCEFTDIFGDMFNTRILDLARLIVAAPKLLEALEKIQGTISIRTHAKGGFSKAEITEAADMALNFARAATALVNAS